MTARDPGDGAPPTAVDAFDTGTQTATDVDQPLGPASVAARGDDIGRYLVLGEIGVGGLGQVLRGYDPDLHREVAIKLVRSDRRAREDLASTQRSHRRLLREAQAIARLSHPNVVAVYEVDEHDGDVFIAMEYVRGASLRAWLQGDRATEDVIETFVQAGRGLVAAHEAGLVHRDFKPSNVLVGDDGRVRVVDFGLARSFASDGDDDGTADLVSSPNDTVTVAGAVVGTPAYMAPEQLDGGEVDARADQFAFCLSLYEALTGERPRWERGAKTIELTRIGSLPRNVGGVIRRGLAVEPGGRFRDMETLLSALRPESTGRGSVLAMVALLAVAGVGSVALTKSSKPAPHCDAAKDMSAVWSERVRGKLMTSLGGADSDAYRAFARGVDGYAGAIGTMRAENCRATRVLGDQSPELMDLRSGCLAQRAAELSALLSLLSEAPSPAVVARTPEMLVRLPSVASCRSVAGLRSEVPLPETMGAADKSADLQREFAGIRAQIAAGMHANAGKRAEAVVAKARKLQHAPTLAKALLLRGEVLDGEEKGQQAETFLREAALQADKGRDDATRAAAYTTLINTVGVLQERKGEGNMYIGLARGVASRLASDELRAVVAARASRFYWWHGDFDQALTFARGAVDMGRRSFGENDPRTGDALWLLGVIHSERRDHKKAKPRFENALAVYKRSLGSTHLKVGKALNSLAIVNFDLGDKKRAEALYREALAVFDRVGAPALRRAMTVMNLGNSLSSRGEYDSALTEYARSEKIIVASVGDKHSRYADLLVNKASTLSKMGRHGEALAALDSALAIRLKRFGDKHPITAATYRTLGNSYRRARKLDKAVPQFERAIAVHEARGGAKNPMLLRALTDLGETRMQQGKLPQARVILRRAESLAIDNASSHTASWRASIPHMLSEVLWRLGDRDGARAAAKRAVPLYREANRPERVKEIEAFLATGRLAAP